MLIRNQTKKTLSDTCGQGTAYLYEYVVQCTSIIILLYVYSITSTRTRTRK